jgi:hypothetical protein
MEDNHTIVKRQAVPDNNPTPGAAASSRTRPLQLRPELSDIFSLGPLFKYFAISWRELPQNSYPAALSSIRTDNS